jgi:DNA-binding winged helix-turn-helix (wHTH) protein
MDMQYWVGDFFIDLTRNQITQKMQSQTIPPKALAVLTYLAKNVNKVVSHNELLSEVWPDTVVTPNTLQRSIAQLRKALGEDKQSFIKTHPKQGYSLEVEVRWQNSINSTSSDVTSDVLTNNHSSQEGTVDNPQVKESTAPNSAHHSAPSRVALKLISMVAGFIIIAIIGYQNLTSKQTPQLTFDKLSSLTATDDKEFDATYTPDGNYIVFHRYLDKECVSKIWAKNINTQKEILLTKDWGAYGRHSFSKDGKKLVFLATQPCNQPVTQRDCFDLVSLDFDKSLESPQQPSVILKCKNSILKKPIWLNDGNITLKQRDSNRWKLINYSPSLNKSTDLYVPSDGSLIDYAYSATDDLIAVARIHKDSQQYVELIKPDGQLLSSHPIERPPEISKFRSLYPNFDPVNKQLFFSTGRQLFTLSYEGEVNKINSPFSDRMEQPEFHPSGKRLLMLKGPYDSDIVKVPLNEVAGMGQQTHRSEVQTSQYQPDPPQSKLSSSNRSHHYASFERTNLEEDYALFQPAGKLIAFLSARSGEEQLWVSDGEDSQKLTNFPLDTYINGIDWAEDGKSLLVNANNVLTQVFLDSTQKTFPMEHSVIRLYQWDSKNNSVLMAVRVDGVIKIVEFDLNKSDFREVSDKFVFWTLKSEDGRLILYDHMGQFWKPGPVEPLLIKALNKQGGKSRSFIIKSNTIYDINDNNQLWSYDLNNDDFKILGEVGNDVDYLTDINQTQLLMTIQVSAKKEVVELTLSK